MRRLQTEDDDAIVIMVMIMMTVMIIINYDNGNDEYQVGTGEKIIDW